MSLHKLLQKQVRRCLPESLQNSKELASFLNAVGDSYTAYEKDAELAERAFRLNEEEYTEINERLVHEIEVKKRSVQKLKETIHAISGNHIANDTDDLLEIANYLNEEAGRRREAEQKFSLLVANLQSGIMLEDENGNITYVNDVFKKMFCCDESADEMTLRDRIESARRKSHLLKYPGEYISRHIQISIERKPASGEVLEMANGNIYERDYIPIFNSGVYKGSLFTYNDVTEKRRAQGMVRNALERVGDNVWEHNYLKEETMFSRPHIEMISYRADMKKRPSDLWYDHIHPEDRWLVEGLDRKYRSGEIDGHEKEYRMVNDEGQVYWVLDRGMMLERAPDGAPLKTVGTHTDITKIKETEQALRESEQTFRTIAENIPGVIYKYCYKNRKGSFVYISPNSEEKIGITPQQLADFYGIIHPGDYERERATRRRTIGNGIPYHFEGRFVVPGKPLIWLCISSSLSRADNDGALIYTGIITNITKDKEAEIALQMREEKYRNILANMNLGLIEVDNKDIIQSVNNSFCEMSGYTHEELVSREATPIFMKGDGSFVMKQKNSKRKTGYSDVYEILVENKTGESRWWLISGAPSYNDAGQMVGSIGIHLDITDQKKLETELIKARQQAEESAKSKQIFLANMSHEIRTPMNAIIGMSKQLSKTVLNTQQRTFLETIHSAADNLLVVINDVLDLSKMEAGKLNIETIDFSLQDVMNRAINVVEHKAEEKGLKVKLEEWDLSISEVLLGDPYRMNQILLNLLSNAVKFTEKGFIRVSARCLQNSIEQQLIKIEVEDTGVGMEEEYVEKIFEAFNQEYNSNTRKFGGTGLGMHICKQLIEMMDGTIEVKSEKGVGTKITLVIQYQKSNAKKAGSEKTFEVEAKKLVGKRILVADDNEMNRFLLNVIFESYHSIILEAKNGREAVEILRRERVDIVLMDIQMPVMDGTEATRLIRNELKSDVPVIALTANAIKGYHEEYMQSGMNAYVLKPFNEDDLLRTVIKWMYAKESVQAASAITEEKVMNHQPDQLFNLSQLIEISRNNDGFVTKMIGLFIVQAQTFISEIESAVSGNDYVKIAAVAHKLKPSVANICHPLMFDEIRGIELLAQQEESLEKIRELLDEFLAHLHTVISQLEQELAVFTERSAKNLME